LGRRGARTRRRTRDADGRLAAFGGLMTLIGTSPNIIVSRYGGAHGRAVDVRFHAGGLGLAATGTVP
jgi:hypothetical protein